MQLAIKGSCATLRECVNFAVSKDYIIRRMNFPNIAQHFVIHLKSNGQQIDPEFWHHQC